MPELIIGISISKNDGSTMFQTEFANPVRSAAVKVFGRDMFAASPEKTDNLIAHVAVKERQGKSRTVQIDAPDKPASGMAR